jgi:hypothetical protein
MSNSADGSVPNIIEAILDGQQPEGVALPGLMAGGAGGVGGANVLAATLHAADPALAKLQGKPLR